MNPVAFLSFLGLFVCVAIGENRNVQLRIGRISSQKCPGGKDNCTLLSKIIFYIQKLSKRFFSVYDADVLEENITVTVQNKFSILGTDSLHITGAFIIQALPVLTLKNQLCRFRY